ncbi:allantoinase AllB [Neobacillus sp. PS3-12]|jgi:allantoinase|uniref:allantoinase AllB n=1 Tax=Neobacillus sp. PS3-12 TaxID=3070677 RepID=UPI0027DFECCF|nr:allantoinase AllB [Neobacillus sp. PS3-12]WML52317.1 allantoinase AllB [Neobacillus sp. PS3-12]
MRTELWVKNGLVYTDKGFQQMDIKVTDQKIDLIRENNAEPLAQKQSVTIIDASGCLVVPGFIDAHVHFNDPGRTAWEGMETGSRAAAIGGTTTLFDMPLNCKPSVTSLQSLVDKKRYLSSLSYVDYALWGGMTGDTIQSQEFTRMEEGIIAWKAFMCESGIEDFKMVSYEELKQAMKIAKEQNKILALHAEWEDEMNKLTSFYKQTRINDRIAYLNSRPIYAEEKAVSNALELAAAYGTSVHFVHISSSRVIEMIQQAKKSGVNVTVETCPHYLVFDDQDFIRQGPILKCAPPLRSREEVEKLWDCINRGWVDTIASDHSPCLYSMKLTNSIWDAWGGIQGVQYTWLALLDQALKRKISLSRIIPLGTVNVADRFGVADRKGRILSGMDADLVLIALDEQTHVDQKSMAFRNPFSPYEDFTFQLKIKKTILRGKVIYDDQIGVTEKHGICLL